MNNYTIYHCHTDISNLSGAGMDSVTKYQDYVVRAKECGMNALCFSEHGNFFLWKKKNQASLSDSMWQKRRNPSYPGHGKRVCPEFRGGKYPQGFRRASALLFPWPGIFLQTIPMFLIWHNPISAGGFYLNHYRLL